MGTARSLNAVIGILVLVAAAGVLGRWARFTRTAAAVAYTPPLSPLETIPHEIGPYQGRDIPLRADVMQVAGVDTYIQREYLNRATGKRLLLYIGYWGRENIGTGHGPEVCYPAAGWKTDSPPVERSLKQAAGTAGKPVPVALHRFERTEPEGVHRIAVGFLAVVSGRYQASSRGVFWHRPGYLLPDGGHYLTQVHVSTVPEADGWEEADADILELMELALPFLAERLPRGVE